MRKIPSGYFLPYQKKWIADTNPLKICEKGRQIGLTHADAYDSVRKCLGLAGRPQDVWVSSRDAITARQYVRMAGAWVRQMEASADNLGLRILEPGKKLTAFVLRFHTGKYLYSLSSSPDALVGKTGHIKLDEFAAHQDQKELYRIAKPCTTWGGQLSIISTHRGTDSVFNDLIRGIQTGNAMGWSHHRISIHDAVNQGLVETINRVTSSNQTRQQFLDKTKAECIDEEQWEREYCCNPSDANESFLTAKLLDACTLDTLTLVNQPICGIYPENWYIGVDVARKKDLCVIDIGRQVGDVIYDQARVEMHNTPFDQMEKVLWSLLTQSGCRRACIDATGLGLHLAERAHQRYGVKVEPVVFTAPTKEALAYTLLRDFQTGKLRIPYEPVLRQDLLAVRKTVSASGHIHLGGRTEDSHCDRFWAKALRQYAARPYPEIGAYAA